GIQTVGLEREAAANGTRTGRGDRRPAGGVRSVRRHGAVTGRPAVEAVVRCEGWTAGDVARHVVGTATDVATGVVGTHTPDEEVAERKGRTPTEIADELDTALVTLRNLGTIINDDAWNGPSPVPDLTMRQGILHLIYG